MENLHWELSVLSKAIHYKNLSGAAQHVGLSQPQLSRIISRLESELAVVLLDRTARRKSGWTPIAYKIADTYMRNSRKLTAALQRLQADDQIVQLNIGSLEGLLGLASSFAHQLFEQSKVQLVELNVFDLSDLEDRFEKGDLDVVFTFREPGRHKFKNIRNLGYQTFDKIESESGFRVLSPFEYSHLMGKKQFAKNTRTMLSNSLAVRRLWVDQYGGAAVFPSEVRRKKVGTDDEVPVYLIASDLISPAFWEKINKFRL